MNPCAHTPKVARGLCSRCYQRARRQIPLDKPLRASAGHGEQIAIRCTEEQLHAWERAAKRARLAFRDWIRFVLDRESGSK